MTTLTGVCMRARSTEHAIGRLRAGKGCGRVAGSRDSTVEAGVLADLGALGDVPRSAGLAQSALALARAVDDVSNSATSRSMCARELRETLDRLRALAPVKGEKSGIDDLRDRRAARRAAAQA